VDDELLKYLHLLI